MPLAGEVRQVGPYVLGRTLGSGGFASVREATHESTHERVAMKCIERNALNPDATIKRETSLCRTLTHRNVVAYKAHYVTERSVYLALELAEGGELYDQLEQCGTFTEAKAREFFTQLVDGVRYCHSMGVCHRDLKLENLLVSADGTLKITDLGFSTQFTCGSPKSVVGTALYVAPEVVLRDGREYNGEAADIWSMGIILYLLTAGRFPFNRGQVGGVGPGMPRAAKERFRNDNFRVMPQFSASLTSLLRRILCADPARRATIDEIRRHEWYTCGKASDAAPRPRVSSPVSTPPRPPESLQTADKEDDTPPPPPVALDNNGREPPPSTPPRVIADDHLPWDLVKPILEGSERPRIAAAAAAPYIADDDDDFGCYEDGDGEPWESAEEVAWHSARARTDDGSTTAAAGGDEVNEVVVPGLDRLSLGV
jgi:serine/threonine-protein kinase SRK2